MSASRWCWDLNLVDLFRKAHSLPGSAGGTAFAAPWTSLCLACPAYRVATHQVCLCSQSCWHRMNTPRAEVSRKRQDRSVEAFHPFRDQHTASDTTSLSKWLTLHRIAATICGETIPCHPLCFSEHLLIQPPEQSCEVDRLCVADGT